MEKRKLEIEEMHFELKNRLDGHNIENEDIINLEAI